MTAERTDLHADEAKLFNAVRYRILQIDERPPPLAVDPRAGGAYYAAKRCWYEDNLFLHLYGVGHQIEVDHDWLLVLLEFGPLPGDAGISMMDTRKIERALRWLFAHKALSVEAQCEEEGPWLPARWERVVTRVRRRRTGKGRPKLRLDDDQRNAALLARTLRDEGKTWEDIQRDRRVGLTRKTILRHWELLKS